MYFNSKNMVKVKIATAQGKKLHDKREDLKKKTMLRETQQALKNY
jgi:SsrA-binding protein